MLDVPLEVKTIVPPKVTAVKQIVRYKKKEPGVVPVTVTMYTGENARTASGAKPKIGTIAVSRNLKKKYKYGSWVHLKGYGRFLVTDLMHPRWHNRVDIWTPSAKRAIKHGVQYSELKQVKNPTNFR